jgi:hypothetical protein
MISLNMLVPNGFWLEAGGVLSAHVVKPKVKIMKRNDV